MLFRSPFSHWIRGAPKEKWSFLYDTNRIRYGIQTTNHEECFNMVMRSCRAFPLVGIVEFIMYGCMKYFREWYMAASININNPQIQLCRRVTEYMKEKIAKAKQHRGILRNVECSILLVMSELSTVWCDHAFGLWIAATRASSVDGELPWRCCGR